MKLSLPPIEEVLPHRGTMQLLDEVTAFTDEAATCAYQVDGNAWYAQNRAGMPVWIGVELMAQAVAAHVALMARRHGKPVKPGALLGTRNFVSQRALFLPGERLAVTACLEFRDESGLAAYACSIATGGTTVTEATLKVFEPEDFAQFIATAKEPS